MGRRKKMPAHKKKITRVIALDGDKLKFRYTTKDRAGGNGFGINEEGVGYTLNTIDQHMVAVFYNEEKEGREV